MMVEDQGEASGDEDVDEADDVTGGPECGCVLYSCSVLVHF